MKLRRSPLILFLLISVAAATAAQLSKTEPEAFLQKQVAATVYELTSLEKGQIIVKLPKTPEAREVAVFSIMRLDVPEELFLEKVRDIVTFKKSDNILQIGKFSNDPQLEDLADLTLDKVDVDAIRRCKVNSCDLKLSAHMIERFAKGVNWSDPNYRDRVNELARGILLEIVQKYMKDGNTALGELNDKSYAVHSGDELRALLQPAPYMYDYAPEFQTYLEDFPRSRSINTEDFFYWSKEVFGMKPVVSVTHVSIYKRQHPGGTDVLIASKGIFATHYFEASLGLTEFIHGPTASSQRSYAIYINRSRVDVLRGFLGGLKRTLISGRLRDGTRKNMQVIKQKLEGEEP
jgi:hypothetical protein